MAKKSMMQKNDSEIFCFLMSSLDSLYRVLYLHNVIRYRSLYML